MQFRQDAWKTAVLVVLAVSAAVNVLQAKRIHELVNRATDRSVLIGTRVAPLAAVTPDGLPARVSFDEGLPTVLYYFSSTCGWCERNWANVSALADGAKGRYRVIALTTEKGIQPYLERRGLRIEVLEQLSEDAIRALRLGATPHSIVVGPDGIVTHEWRGTYTSRIARQVEELFGLALPGVTPAPVKQARRE